MTAQQQHPREHALQGLIRPPGFARKQSHIMDQSDPPQSRRNAVQREHEGARNCFSTEQKKSAQQTAEDNTEHQAVGQHPEAAFASPESNQHGQQELQNH